MERPAIARDIGEARAHGDLSENAEYHAAKNKQGLIETRIGELEHILSVCQVIDPAAVGADGRCIFGAYVRLRDGQGGEISYRLVGECEANVDLGRLSHHPRPPDARSSANMRETPSASPRPPAWWNTSCWKSAMRSACHEKSPPSTSPPARRESKSKPAPECFPKPTTPAPTRYCRLSPTPKHPRPKKALLDAVQKRRERGGKGKPAASAVPSPTVATLENGATVSRLLWPKDSGVFEKLTALRGAPFAAAGLQSRRFGGGHSSARRRHCGQGAFRRDDLRGKKSRNEEKRGAANHSGGRQPRRGAVFRGGEHSRPPTGAAAAECFDSVPPLRGTPSNAPRKTNCGRMCGTAANCARKKRGRFWR